MPRPLRAANEKRRAEHAGAQRKRGAIVANKRGLPWAETMP